MILSALIVAALVGLLLFSPWEDKPGAGKKSVEEAAAEMDIRGRMPKDP